MYDSENERAEVKRVVFVFLEDVRALAMSFNPL